MEVFAESFSKLGDELGITATQVAVSNLLPAVIMLVVSLIVVKIITTLVAKGIEKGRVEKSLHTFIKATVKTVLYFLVLIIVLGMLGIPITSLIATLSVAGLAVSLAIQSTLTNITGGVSILATKPFKVGDFIEVGDTSGTVKEIGLVYTKIVTMDKKLVFIPNGKISDTVVTNYNAERQRRLVLKITASYDDDIKKVKKALKEAVDSDERILEDPAPLINVSNYLESSIEYIVAVWVKSSDYWDVNWYLLEEVKHSFDRNDVTMTYNHINVHMVNE